MAVFVENRKARFNYEILESFEAGIKLLGIEVKSLKNGHGIFDGSYITVRGGEAFLMNFSIPPYQPGNTSLDYDGAHPKKLLLKKKELQYLATQEDKKGLTIVPLSLYSNKNRIKVELAIVRGKKLYNKREALKKRDISREVRRELKGGL